MIYAHRATTPRVGAARLFDCHHSGILQLISMARPVPTTNLTARNALLPWINGLPVLVCSKLFDVDKQDRLDSSNIDFHLHKSSFSIEQTDTTSIFTKNSLKEYDCPSVEKGY